MLSKLAAELAPLRRKPTLREWLKTRDKEDLKALSEAAVDTNITTEALVKFFRGKSVKVGWATVQTWRESHGFSAR